ncbi:hypothetical protein EJA72_29270, partial [Pseudomonas sp. PB120]|nr:hypothetical protein [Pseudomonas sp. PB120]
LLAMDVNDNAPSLDDRVVWKSIASRLAPTGECVRQKITVRAKPLAAVTQKRICPQSNNHLPQNCAKAPGLSAARHSTPHRS